MLTMADASGLFRGLSFVRVLCLRPRRTQEFAYFCASTRFESE